MKVLVTGGAGFIGSFMTDELVKSGKEVIVLDNLDPQVHPEGKVPKYLNPLAEFIKGDVRDRSLLARILPEVDAVFHYAAAVGVAQSQYRVEHYADVNIRGTATLMDLLVNDRVERVRKVVVAASMTAYGEGLYADSLGREMRPPIRREEDVKDGQWEPRSLLTGEPVKPLPIREDAARHGESIYAITKDTQERMVLGLGKTYGIPSVALRYFNVYGPRQSLANPYTGVAAIFLARLKAGQAPVVYEDGLQTRDFVSVHDAVRAGLLTLETSSADYQALNIGSGVGTTVVDLARRLSRLTGKQVEPVVNGQFRKGDVRHCTADISLARRQLGFEPRVTLDDGLRELVEWSATARSTDCFEKAMAELRKRGLAP